MQKRIWLCSHTPLCDSVLYQKPRYATADEAKMQNTDALHDSFFKYGLILSWMHYRSHTLKDMKILEEYSFLTSENKPFKYSNK